MSSFATGSCDSAATLAASGAEKFARFKSSEFSKSVRIHAADEARRFYEQARRVCYDPKMRTVLAKNQATVCLRLVELRGYAETVALEGVIYTARDAANLLSEALFLACKDGEIVTLEKVRVDMERLSLAVASVLVDELDSKIKRVSRLEGLVKSLRGEHEDLIKLMLTKQSIRQLFVASDLALDPPNQESVNWRSSLSALEDAARSLREMEAYLRKLADSPLGSYLAFPDELEFIECSRERLQKSFLRSECLRSLYRADGMLGQLLELNEDFDVDLAWDIVDELVHCSKMAESGSGCILEQAMALAKVGRLFHMGLKLSSRAQPYLLNAMKLAAAISEVDGTAFFSQAWYRDAKTSLESIREQKAAADKENYDKQREPTLLKLKPKLDALDKAIDPAGVASKVAKAFNLAKHICENLQGKNETSMAKFTTAVEDLPAQSSDDFNKMLRKALLKAAMVYHPDKNDDHGLEWKVLCEEVSKRINNATCDLKGFC
mmetsp:Transcript_16496/g.32843  ORF Transcript_16496/g.32843 Transcript_16496/m.32843 type:complete len:493 (+) Transcript_16496:199-1677(+)